MIRWIVMLTSVLGIIILFGCEERAYFEEIAQIDSEGWKFEDPIRFDFDIADTSLRYDILLTVTHSKEYLYENIYTRIATMYPDQETKSQTLSIDVANKAGVWFGECSGNSCTVEVTLQQNAFFDQLGEHTISFEQFTRDDPLVGIEELALILQEVELH